jgi:hypothetical protein
MTRLRLLNFLPFLVAPALWLCHSELFGADRAAAQSASTCLLAAAVDNTGHRQYGVPYASIISGIPIYNFRIGSSACPRFDAVFTRNLNSVQ